MILHLRVPHETPGESGNGLLDGYLLNSAPSPSFGCDLCCLRHCCIVPECRCGPLTCPLLRLPCGRVVSYPRDLLAASHILGLSGPAHPTHRTPTRPPRLLSLRPPAGTWGGCCCGTFACPRRTPSLQECPVGSRTLCQSRLSGSSDSLLGIRRLTLLYLWFWRFLLPGAPGLSAHLHREAPSHH